MYRPAWVTAMVKSGFEMIVHALDFHCEILVRVFRLIALTAKFDFLGSYRPLLCTR